MTVILEAQRRAGGSLKNTPASLIAEALSSPLIAFPDFTYAVVWWLMELLVWVYLQLFIVEPLTLTTGLLNKTITGKRNWIVLTFTVRTYSTVNNFLSVCIFVYSWQTSVTLMPKVVVMFFPPTVEQKVHLYIHNAFLGPARGGLPKCIVQPL